MGGLQSLAGRLRLRSDKSPTAEPTAEPTAAPLRSDLLSAAQLDALARAEGYAVYYPESRLCTDNGAMIAGLGCRLLAGGARADLTLDADPMAGR